MEIIIEYTINPPESLKIINDELEVLKYIIEQVDVKLKLDKVILTADIERRVNEFYGMETFQAIRKHGENFVNVAAKYCTNDQEGVLFISPFLYNYKDQTVRFFLYLHELGHVINKLSNILPPKANFTTDNYFFTLYWMFDEYTADRFAFNLIDTVFQNKSDLWDEFIMNGINGYIELLLDEKNYRFIIDEINKFRNYQITVNEYTEHVRQLSTDLSASLVHAYSLIHQYPSVKSKSDINSSKFVNMKTTSIIDYIRKKYEASEFDLTDGLTIVTQYLTNFGILFEELETGPYIHILDI